MTVLLQYQSVRWVLWIGGSALLVYFAAKMIYAALHHSAVLATAGEADQGSPRREFFRGIFLAMSSPSAILWFAAVGGTLIARSGGGGIADSGLFLAGFFCAGLVWTLGLCLAATQGGKLLGDKLLRYSYLASAAIFCYFAVYVIYPATRSSSLVRARQTFRHSDPGLGYWLLYFVPNPSFLRQEWHSWMSKNRAEAQNRASKGSVFC